MIQCQLLNGLRAITRKSDYLLFECKHEMMFAKIGQSRIWESEKQKLFGVTFDEHLKFEEHIVKQCNKAG